MRLDKARGGCDRQVMIEAAHALLTARRTGERLRALPGAPASMDEAVAIQRAVQDGLGPIGGWKVGSPTPDGPISCSPLPASGIGSGAPRHGFIEAEIAVVLARDLPVRDAPYTDPEIMAAIASAHPAVEVLASRFASDPDPLSGLADAGGHAGLVLGPAIAGWADVDYDSEAVEVRVGGIVVKSGRGNPGGPMLRLLRWMADTGARWDGGLRAGQVITTGSWTGKDWVAPDQAATVAFSRCGTVPLTPPPPSGVRPG